MWTKRNWGPTQVGSGKFFSPYPSRPLMRQERLLSVGTDGGGYINLICTNKDDLSLQGHRSAYGLFIDGDAPVPVVHNWCCGSLWNVDCVVLHYWCAHNWCGVLPLRILLMRGYVWRASSFIDAWLPHSDGLKWAFHLIVGLLASLSPYCEEAVGAVNRFAARL